MARLLINGEWFDAISAEALFERDFEEVILANAPILYPDFIAVRFKTLVQSEYGAAKADLALIDRQYREWWVVEVELGSHPLRGHVEDQVSRLASALYGEAEARHLAKQDEALDEASLLEMMRGRQPRVFVLVNQAKPDWSSALIRWNAVLGVAELFRSRLGNMTVLRINGDQPANIGDVVSVCRVEPAMSGCLRIDSPAGLGFTVEERGEIWFDGGLTEWSRLETAAAVWLVPVRRYPLPAGVRSFVLRRGEDGRLVLEPRDP